MATSSSTRKRGLYREYLRDVEKMPRRMRIEVEKVISEEAKQSNADGEAALDISFLDWLPEANESALECQADVVSSPVSPLEVEDASEGL